MIPIKEEENRRQRKNTYTIAWGNTITIRVKVNTKPKCYNISFNKIISSKPVHSQRSNTRKERSQPIIISRS